MNAVQFWIVDTIVKVNPALLNNNNNNYSSTFKYTNSNHEGISSLPRDEETGTSPAISRVIRHEENERTPLLH